MNNLYGGRYANRGFPFPKPQMTEHDIETGYPQAEQIVIPYTIKMINLVQPGNNCILLIIGFITEIEYDEENSISFYLQDGGPGFIRCILYSSNLNYAYCQDSSHQFSSLEITGQLRYDDEGNRYLYIYKFKKLRDMNVITSHLLSVIHTNLLRFQTKKITTIGLSIMDLPDEVARKIIPYIIPTVIPMFPILARDELRNYQFVSRQFWRLIHSVTRNSSYRYLCQTLHAIKILPHIRFFISNNGEMFFDQSESIPEGYQDPDGVAKMMTLKNNFSGEKLKMVTSAVEKWLPPLIRQLEWMRENDRKINCKLIQFVKRENWHWETNWDQGGIEECRKKFKRFIYLVDILSQGKCTFEDGLSCCDCHSLNFNKEWFQNADATSCYYCKRRDILPNFRCRSCINPCQCYREVGFPTFCNSFVCNNCVVDRFISQEMTWISPGCTNIIQ